jgi:hypothetical protein
MKDEQRSAVFTQGAEKEGLWNLRVQVEADLLDPAADFLHEMVEYQRESGHTLQPEESIASGIWAVACKEVDGYLEFWEFQGDWSDVEPGMNRTLTYLLDMMVLEEEYGLDLEPPDPTWFAVVTDEVLQGELPVAGFRYPDEAEEISGWWVMPEGLEDNPDMERFKPVHLYHLMESYPQIAALLTLSPGHGFILKEDEVEILFDSDVQEEEESK